MKRISKIVAALMFSTAIMGTATSTTFAATTYDPIGGTTSFTKNLVVESDANIPDIEFTYTIAPGTAVNPSTTNLEILTSNVTATVGTAQFSNADTAGATDGLPTDADPSSPTAGSKYAQKTVNITFPATSFTKPGVYRYVLNEVNGGAPGVTYDATARYLDVFVVADPATDELSVDSYVLRSTETNIGTDGDYTSDPDVKSSGYTNSVTQYDFTFTKAITGNQGDKNKRFNFTLNISNAVPGVYPVITNDVTGNPTTITVAANGTYTGTFSLTNGSSFQVVNLNKDAVCSVSEAEEDYTPTYSIDSAAAVDGNASGNITLANASHEVAFTNTRDGIIPTGVLLTIAPFAVGLFLFGTVIVFTMTRRRREVY